jgi:hypothetical protein
MNKRFAAKVLERFPQFRVAGEFFVFAPVRDVICGFLQDRPPSGLGVWNFAVPAYDRVDLLHMTFGERLPFSGEKGSPAIEAENFARCIEPHVETIAALGSAANFLKVAEILAPNPWCVRAHAMTLAWLGRRREAMSQLERVAGMPGVSRYERFLDDIAEVRDALQMSTEHARSLLKEWRVATLKKFGLE